MADPASHGSVAPLVSPSGAAAHMTTPSTTPAPVPMASVAGATRGRRAVMAGMAATSPATMSKKTVSANQV